MVSSSNPFAARAALRMLECGGNAADAALAGAAMLSVAEPMNIGPGGDLFALVAHGGTVVGLDSAGPAPRTAEPLTPVDVRGPRSVTVPGAVAGWAALSERFGRLGLDAALSDAIDAADRGLPVCARAAALWAEDANCPPGFGPPAPSAGEVIPLPELAGTLRLIADRGPDAFYRGPIARAIAEASWLTEEDLLAFAPRWVEPLRAGYRDHAVLELPPPTQGVIALEALRLLDGEEPTLANMVRAVALALEDGAAHIRDGADVSWLLADRYVAERRRETPGVVDPVDAGTSHLCVVDSDRMAVSLIGSLFASFGSGCLAAGTGVVLQSRGACFATEGGVVPGRRPYHTIIPAMVVGPEGVCATFGVVGGHLQAQAHVQLISALLDDHLDPQAALDRARFRIEGSRVLLEEGLWPSAPEISAVGLQPERSRDWSLFGSGQAITIVGELLLGGSDPRMDGCALGF